MAITPTDFEKIWSTNASTPAYTFTDSDYLEGWDFVGNLPPTRAQWNAIQKRTDEKMKYIFDHFGSPLTASTVADMTLENRVYVYTGSEVGYTAGDWYYYDAGTSTWVDGGVYNAVAVVTDTTLTQAGVPADAKVVGDDFADMDLLSINRYTLHYGVATQTNTWNYINSSYQHIIIPITSGDTITIEPGSNALYYGILTSYTTPVYGASVPFSADANWNSRKSIASTTKFYKFKAPSDAQYLILFVIYNGTSTYPNSLTINGIEYAKSSRTALYDSIGSVSNKLNTSQVVPLSAFDRYYGFLGASKTWINYGSKAYQVVVVPCNGGENVEINANTTALYYGALTSFDGAVSGGAISYSTDASWNDRKSLSANSSTKVTLPTDARFLCLCVLNNNNDATPKKLIIDGIDYTKTVYDNIRNLGTDGNHVTAIGDVMVNGIVEDILWESGTFTQVIGAQSTNVTQLARIRMSSAIKRNYPLTISSDGTFKTMLALYDNDLLLTSKTSYTTASKDVPTNTYFRVVIEDATDNTTDISSYTSEQVSTKVVVSNKRMPETLYPDVNWCAMGDSITAGYVSYLNGGTPTYKIMVNDCWAYKVSQKTGWKLTNLGIGGTGWNKATNQEVALGIDTTSAHYLARHTDFTPYNLVTLAYGINDWKANYPTGSMADDITTPASTIAGMRATIEAIMLSNPLCKIIVILPLNCIGYGFSYGDQSTNYALGYRFSNSGTLDEFSQKMIEVCNYYGIQYIDQTHYSCINRQNLLSCVTDGVHPNLATHSLLAGELCKKITFG